MSNYNSNSPFYIAIVLIGIGTGLGIFALLFFIGLKAFVGSAISTAIMSTAALPILEAGAGLAGATFTLNVIVKQFNSVQKEPYKWLLPIMGIFAAFTVDVLKEFIVKTPPEHFEGLSETVVTAAVAGTTLLIYFIAGIFWQFEKTKKAHVPTKIIAVILFLLPLFLAYIWYIVHHSNRELWTLLTELDGEVIAPLGVFLLLFVITLFFGYRYRK